MELEKSWKLSNYFFNRYKSRSGGFFFVHTSLVYYGLHTNPSFGAGLPDFKRTYLRPQEELENVLTIQIEPEFSALSVYEVSRAIPALLPYQNNDFRGVNEKTPTLYPFKKIIATCTTLFWDPKNKVLQTTETNMLSISSIIHQKLFHFTILLSNLSQKVWVLGPYVQRVNLSRCRLFLKHCFSNSTGPKKIFPTQYWKTFKQNIKMKGIRIFKPSIMSWGILVNATF